MEHTSRENISEALQLLEEAARQKKDELRTVLSEKFTHLRSLIMGNDSGLVDSLTSVKDHALRAATRIKEAGVVKARELASGVDKHVHVNPWPYIAGSAAVSVLLGYILGRSRK